MAILGSHTSAAGGAFKAVERAATVGCDCVQIFTKNNNQWRANPITVDDVTRFRDALKEHGITHPISHSSYLINLASPNPELLQKSIDGMVVELERAELLGLTGVVMHPGSYTTSDEETGLNTICNSIDKIHSRLPDTKAQILLENTAGQGSNLGWQFEHLGKLIKGVVDSSRLGVCIDTCHAFAAGYELTDSEGYEKTINKLKRLVGLRKIKAFHLNDSKKPFGSRRDRHEHIGRGEMGLQPFRNLLNDKRFRKVPMYLETAKGEEDGKDLDTINLETLRNLIEK